MTDRYAVVGNPVAHSISPQIHAAFARQTNQHLEYERLLAPLDGFAACIAAFRARGGKGVNVTLPFKLDAYRLAAEVSARAEHAGAVNTLKFEEGSICGDNTDGAGLLRDIEINLGFAVAGKRVLLMGAGGAARGVLIPLLQCAPAQLVIANRTLAKAAELAVHFARWGQSMACDYAGLAQQEFDLVINATSASIADELPALHDHAFAQGALAYDMVYGRERTPFLNFAQAHGAARVADGLGMLVEQAAESFFLWRGVRPATAPVRRMLRPS